MTTDYTSTITCSYCREDVPIQTHCTMCGAPLDTHVEDPLGHRVGNYILERLLAEGANGRLYCAKHIATEQLVALKLLHSKLVNHSKSIRRLRREAEIGIRLQHPNAVKLFEFGVDPDFGLFLVMELIVGQTLFQLLAKEQCLEPQRALSIALQTCEVLDKAHYLEIVHRDLKPSNIMLKWHPTTKDFVKVCDFGMAKLETYDNMETKLTVPGTVHGTPGYMAPEQCKGEETDTRTDIYAMGVILYQMLTGHLPFHGNNVIQLLQQQLFHKPPALQQMAPHLQQFESIHLLEQVVSRCLDNSPDARYPNVEALRQELVLTLPSYTPFEILLEDHSIVEQGSLTPTPPAYFPRQMISLNMEQQQEAQKRTVGAPQQTFLPDQTLFQEGQSPTRFYLILEGEVRMVRHHEQYIVELDRLGPDQFLGLSAYFSHSPYTISAVAAERTRLRLMDSNFLNRLFAQEPHDQSLFHALYHEETLQLLLRYSPFFASLPPDSRYELIQKGELHSFGPKQVVVNMNQKLDSLYLIASGSITQKTKLAEQSSAFSKLTYNMGETFGETQILSQQPADATYVTQTNTVLLGIPLAVLNFYMQHFPYLRHSLEQLAQTRLAERLQLQADLQVTSIDQS